MQLMSSNDERTITSSMTARETPARPMPRVAACAREKTFAKGLPSGILKIRDKRGPDRLVANDRAESGRDVEPFAAVRAGRRERRSHKPHQFCDISGSRVDLSKSLQFHTCFANSAFFCREF
jgi:hypothetical protein